MFTEGHVEVDGIRARYLEAGQGAPLVHFGADLSTPSPAHELLARRFRVIAFETPPPGRPGSDAAATIGRVIESLGLTHVDLVASADASQAALWFALAEPERVRALVLEAPAAIGAEPRGELERRLPEVTTPTLVLFGTADRQAAQDTGRVYTTLIPKGHLVFVYDAAHAIGRDRPEAFAEVVADFLERHEAFIISRTPTVIHP
jgi:pimeloyl-ACP methyl ester carboxylesterase